MHRYPRWLAGVAVLALVAAACTAQPLDDPGIGAEASLTSIVYAADGSVLAEWHAGEDRVLVEYDEIPRHVLNAVVAIEDERYWTHSGVDLRALARAVIANVEAGEIVQGGSTITQQYLKNVLLTPEITLDRKIEEAALAVRLEVSLTKEQILERYLNTVYFGRGAYGIGTAAGKYFDKEIDDLTIAEGALLAGLIKSPSRTDPYNDPAAAIDRRRLVLQKMAELEFITEDEAIEANGRPLALAPPQPPDRARFPYFVEEVKRRLLDDPGLGVTATDRYNALFRGGLRIYTTLDPVIQEAAEVAVGSVLEEGGPSAALAAVDPRTGHVLALVGGRDFYDPDDPVAQFNLATQGRRQAGSAFKPFALAAALESGMTLDAVFEGGDEVTVQTDSGPWTVANYNGTTFPDLTLLEATVFSVNVVYARVIDVVGPERVAGIAEAAGITTNLEPFHSVGLGAQEVSVLDMASAYGTFAAGGTHVEPVMVTRIDTHDGVNLWEATPAVTTALERHVADGVTAALTEVVRRGTGQQAKIGRPAAGKTGTSQAHGDAWFVGYTPELSAAIWMGFAEGLIPMEPPTTTFAMTGGSYPALVWSRFAGAALTGVPYGQLAQADGTGLMTVQIDLSTGFLAGPLCPRASVQRIQVPVDAAPTVVCPIHNPAGMVELGSQAVPDVIGLHIGAAVELLEGFGYNVAVDWDEPGPLATGTIYGQEPSASFPAPPGSVVRLTVAGPEPGSVVPGVLGIPVADAVVALSDLGIAVDVRTEAEADPDDALRRSGLVWSQMPAVGTPLPTAVTIWVNP